MRTPCKSCKIIATIHGLTVPVSYDRSTKFASLWASAINELSPLLEQDVPVDTLKVHSQTSFATYPSLIRLKGEVHLGET
jgi:hypothetical protein